MRRLYEPEIFSHDSNATQRQRSHKAVLALCRFSTEELVQMDRALENLAAAYREIYAKVPRQIATAQRRVEEALAQEQRLV